MSSLPFSLSPPPYIFFLNSPPPFPPLFKQGGKKKKFPLHKAGDDTILALAPLRVDETTCDYNHSVNTFNLFSSAIWLSHSQLWGIIKRADSLI